MSKIIKTIKNLYSEVESIEGKDLIKTMNEDFGIDTIDIALALAEMKETGVITLEGNGASVQDKRIVFNKGVTVKETPKVKVTSTPAKTKRVKSQYGFDIQVDRNGRSYKRQRSEFDGPKIQLPEKYEAMKTEFQRFSQQLREQIVEFNGAGEYAIAILNENPELSKYEDRNGNVYHRWNAENVIPIMDKYWPNVELLLQEEKAQAQGENDGD